MKKTSLLAISVLAVSAAICGSAGAAPVDSPDQSLEALPRQIRVDVEVCAHPRTDAPCGGTRKFSLVALEDTPVQLASTDVDATGLVESSERIEVLAAMSDSDVALTFTYGHELASTEAATAHVSRMQAPCASAVALQHRVTLQPAQSVVIGDERLHPIKVRAVFLP